MALEISFGGGGAGHQNPGSCTCHIKFLPLSSTPSFDFFFQKRSHHVAQAGLELAMKPRLTSNSQSSYFSLQGAGITGIQTTFLGFFFIVKTKPLV